MEKRIMNIMSKPSKDKLLHFIAGILIAENSFTGGLLLSPFANYIVANLITLLILGGKEVYDKFHPKNHTAEIKDFVAGVIGLIFVNLQFVFVYLII